jgi:2-polyprenyl-6-methoxyphenol hydroxylase-like FAD-dependent oxidoreductase
MGKFQQADVLVVGAGPTGLILAHERLRRGVKVRLAEKHSGPSHTTRAFTLHARSMEMFEHIGVAHRLEEVCFRAGERPLRPRRGSWCSAAPCP